MYELRQNLVRGKSHRQPVTGATQIVFLHARPLADLLAGAQTVCLMARERIYSPLGKLSGCGPYRTVVTCSVERLEPRDNLVSFV